MGYDRLKVLECFEKNSDFYENTVKPNIEKYRKGDCKITVTDKDGRPIKNAHVKIKQKSHKFKFGANIFMLDELESNEKNRLYKERFSDVFNMATLPFYWNSTEPNPKEYRFEKSCSKYYRRPSIDLCIEFCKQHGIEPREHALAYEHMFPWWVKDKSVSEVKELLEERFKEIAKRYKDDIPTIEVTNEMFWWSGITSFYDEDDYIEWCLKTARKYFPNNDLVVNEAVDDSWRDVRRSCARYYSYVKYLLEKGVDIDAMGMQFHMFYDRNGEMERASSLYNPKNLYDYLDFYSRIIDKLQITEITIPAYSNEILDEEIQAKIIEYLYTLWFSHPNMEQIIYWNLVDGYAYVADPTPEKIARTQGDMTAGENVYYGGLLRFDMSPKPAYLKIKELTQKIWHTELDSTLNSLGCVDFRGFYGNYEIEISLDNGTVTKEFALNEDVKITI